MPATEERSILGQMLVLLFALALGGAMVGIGFQYKSDEHCKLDAPIFLIIAGITQLGTINAIKLWLAV